MDAARRSGLRGEEPEARRTIESGRRAAEREAWEQGAADPRPEDMPGLRRSRQSARSRTCRTGREISRTIDSARRTAARRPGEHQHVREAAP